MSFIFRDIHPHEEPLALSNCATVPESLIAAVVQRFSDDTLVKLSPTIVYRSALARKYRWSSVMHEVIKQLQDEKGNKILHSAECMRKYCKELPYAQPIQCNGIDVYCFETHTDDYFFFIALRPDEMTENCQCVIRCYDRSALIAAGYEKNNKEI